MPVHILAQHKLGEYPTMTTVPISTRILTRATATLLEPPLTMRMAIGGTYSPPSEGG